MKGKNEEHVIVVDHVKKVYGGKKDEKITYTALKDVSLHVDKGEFVSVLGPSGSGKTTLLDLIGTLDTASDGKIFIDGIDVTTLNSDSLSELRNRKIGFIFQSYNLVPYLDVLQNAVLPLMVDGRDNEENIEKAKGMLNEIGLGDKLEKKPTELSGGEQQRVAIVRAFVNDPPILLADEPTGNLDTKTEDIVLRMLLKLSKEKNTTILMVTHNPEVAALSERSIYLRDGLIEKEIRVRK